ncbi:MAG: hypothetical protein ABEJ05_00865 [Haloglomus sp.]
MASDWRKVTLGVLLLAAGGVVVVGYGLQNGPIPPVAAAAGAVGIVAGTILLGASGEGLNV